MSWEFKLSKSLLRRDSALTFFEMLINYRQQEFSKSITVPLSNSICIHSSGWECAKRQAHRWKHKGKALTLAEARHERHAGVWLTTQLCNLNRTQNNTFVIYKSNSFCLLFKSISIVYKAIYFTMPLLYTHKMSLRIHPLLPSSYSCCLSPFPFPFPN